MLLTAERAESDSAHAHMRTRRNPKQATAHVGCFSQQAAQAANEPPTNELLAAIAAFGVAAVTVFFKASMSGGSTKAWVDDRFAIVPRALAQYVTFWDAARSSASARTQPDHGSK